jgi:hypothetical protein
MRSSVAMLAVVVAVVVPAACAELDNRTAVEDLRVLAVAADPPELFITDFDQPGTIPDVSVSALVVDQRGAGRQVEATLMACALPLDTVTAATGGAAVLCASLPPDLRREFPIERTANGIEHNLRATVTLDQAATALFPRASEADRVYGMPVYTEWHVSAGAGETVETVTAIKRLRFTEPREGWGQQPNRNPTLETVRFWGARDREGVLGDERVEPVPTIAPGTRLFVQPIPAEGAIETDYVTPVATSSGDPTPVAKTIARERLRFAFFTTWGTFVPAVTSSELGPLRERDQGAHFEAEYRAPGPAAPRPADGVVWIWIAVRDERGGTSWTARALSLPP